MFCESGPWCWNGPGFERRWVSLCVLDGPIKQREICAMLCTDLEDAFVNLNNYSNLILFLESAMGLQHYQSQGQQRISLSFSHTSFLNNFCSSLKVARLILTIYIVRENIFMFKKYVLRIYIFIQILVCMTIYYIEALAYILYCIGFFFLCSSILVDGVLAFAVSSFLSAQTLSISTVMSLG